MATDISITSLPALARTAPAAYERQREAIASVPDEALITINVDILSAVTTARGAVWKVGALMPEIRRAFPLADLSCIETLEDRALACAYATSQHTLALTPPEVLSEVASRAIHMRDLLVTDAQSLTKRSLIDASALNGVIGSIAYRAIAHDLILLSSLLRGLSPALGARIASSEAELDEADHLATMLTDHVGLRELSPLIVAEAARTRHRAFTLLVRTYEQVRRVVRYVRWYEDDLEEFAPSLYAGRNNARKKKQPVPDAAPMIEVAPEMVVSDIPEPAFAGLPGGSPLM